MLTNEQIQQFENMLITRQHELIGRLKDHQALVSYEMESVGELTSYDDNHPGDLGTELFEREKDISLYIHAENELAQINDALHAIVEGTYGLCRICSRSIEFDRLLALPEADTCILHADGNINS